MRITQPGTARSRGRRARGGLAVALSVALGLLTAVGTGCGGGDEARPRDVIVVMIDTLRPDHLGFLGHDRDTAPFLRSLAGTSTVFSEAYSTSSWTAPSTASLFTSLYPPQHGIELGFFAHREAGQIALNRLPTGIDSLPERFRAAGYTTFGLATNVNIGPEIGFDRGFDHFQRLHGLSRFESASARKVDRKLQEWDPLLREEGPKLVYLHFNDVHAPYHERQPWYRGEGSELDRKRSAYDSEISFLDQVLATIFERHGWTRDAIVVVVSDHGEEFMEHGRIGHGASLYDELLGVLCLVRDPDRPGGGRSEHRVSLLDILPTLAELCDLERDPRWEGRSLVPLLGEEANGWGDERRLFAHRLKTGDRGGAKGTELWGVLDGRWKLIVRPGREELYDLVEDAAEKENRAAAHPDVVARLREALAEFRTRAVPLATETTDVNLDARDRKSLEALGYVGEEDDDGEGKE